MTALFEVEARNRVVKGLFNIKRIRGTQGNWYEEKLYFLADSEVEAKDLAFVQLKQRRIRGISIRRSRYINREIEIINIRRIA